MQAIHYELWNRCRKFVAVACAGRDASHGLGHMHKVTEQAVLLSLMTPSDDILRRNAELYRIILIGMLHDVADHKYDHDGTLFLRVEQFVESEARCFIASVTETSPLSFPTTDAEAMRAPDAFAALKETLLTCLDAISYSKENSRGMRWFEEKLPPIWCRARDFVSDADKLEAIGEEGLLRCYEYKCSQYKEKASKRRQQEGNTIANKKNAEEASETLRVLEKAMLDDVVIHYGEKLSRLASEFIVTESGKYLADFRHTAMSDLLQEWQKHGPPPATLYLRNAAEEYIQ